MQRVLLMWGGVGGVNKLSSLNSFDRENGTAGFRRLEIDLLVVVVFLLLVQVFLSGR